LIVTDIDLKAGRKVRETIAVMNNRTDQPWRKAESRR
jgi:deaminated glutathione amidase